MAKRRDQVVSGVERWSGRVRPRRIERIDGALPEVTKFLHGPDLNDTSSRVGPEYGSVGPRSEEGPPGSADRSCP